MQQATIKIQIPNNYGIYESAMSLVREAVNDKFNIELEPDNCALSTWVGCNSDTFVRLTMRPQSMDDSMCEFNIGLTIFRMEAVKSIVHQELDKLFAEES